MVKRTQTIRQQIADKLFEFVWPFGGLALKGLTLSLANLSVKPVHYHLLIITKIFQSAWISLSSYSFFNASTCFMPLFSFCIPRKHQKTRGRRKRPAAWNGIVVQEAYVTFLRDCKTNMENSGTEKNYLVLLLILTNFIQIN